MAATGVVRMHHVDHDPTPARLKNGFTDDVAGTTRCSCSTCRSLIRQKFGNASSIRFHSARTFGYETNNIFSVLSQSRRRARNVRLVHCSSKKLRTWFGYACRLYRAKKDSLSQAASAASNSRYELAARIAQTFANLAAKVIAPFGKF
jgi:hypothetical protein